jgi:hypothetical protein
MFATKFSEYFGGMKELKKLGGKAKPQRTQKK